MAANEKYPVFNRDNLTIPILMELSQKQKPFSVFFASFLKYRLNFEHFEKKHDTQSFCISEFANSENVVRYICKECHFRLPFDKQHGKRAQALLKSASQHLYCIHWSLARKLCRESLSSWYAKSWDHLFTHWLPMKCILFWKETS